MTPFAQLVILQEQVAEEVTQRYEGGYVYILRCRDGSLYTGAARNVMRRLEQHRRGKGSRYVASRLPCELVHIEGHKTWSAALKREAYIKGQPVSYKRALVARSESAQ